MTTLIHDSDLKKGRNAGISTEKEECLTWEIDDLDLIDDLCFRCGKIHNPILIRNYGDVSFFNTVQDLLDQYAINKSIPVKGTKVTV